MATSLTIAEMIEELTTLGHNLGFDQTVWVEDQDDDLYTHRIEYLELCSIGDENGVEIKTKRIYRR